MITPLDRQIKLVEEMRTKWNELIGLYNKGREQGGLLRSEINQSVSILSWFQTYYPTLDYDLRKLVKIDYTVVGMLYQNIDPISQIAMAYGSIEEICAHRFQDDILMYFRTGRSCLNTIYGILNERKKRIGDIDINELLKFKENYESLQIDRDKMSERKTQVDKLIVPFKEFKLSEEYFIEAKSCYEFGFFKGATILALSALESAIKSDYLNKDKIEYGGKFLNLLNRYFGDLHRLPVQYQDFSNTYVKIRNAITHPEDFDYSPTLVYTSLVMITELLNHLEENV